MLTADELQGRAVVHFVGARRVHEMQDDEPRVASVERHLSATQRVWRVAKTMEGKFTSFDVLRSLPDVSRKSIGTYLARFAERGLLAYCGRELPNGYGPPPVVYCLSALGKTA